MITEDMRMAEAERREHLEGAYTMLELSKPFGGWPTDEDMLEEAIKSLMIGSHAGRIPS
jgi:hypothetical protein